ncbi:MAG: hypothetical protein ACK5N8_07515 [Alphaproteobacteria bacterium]
MEWDNAILKNEKGLVILYMKDNKGNWIVERTFHPYKAGGCSFTGITRYGSDNVRVVAAANRVDVYMNQESYQMR